MSHAQYAEMLARSKRVLVEESHVVYDDGSHGDRSVDRCALYAHPETLSELCRLLAECFQKDGPIDVVVSLAPMDGALAQWMTRHLSRVLSRSVLATHADQHD